MTEYASVRALRADLAALDLFPACPRCADLLEPDAVVCVACGCRVGMTAAQERAAEREQVAATFARSVRW